MKQVIIRENRLIDLLDRYAHYEADTEPESSGSPVFNNQWEVVALHHSGVPKRNTKGELLRIDGRVWRQEVDLPDLLDWVANEGVRGSRLVEFLARAQVKAAEVALLKALLDASPPRSVEAEVESDETKNRGSCRNRRSCYIGHTGWQAFFVSI
jgi:hypothetical protein